MKIRPYSEQVSTKRIEDSVYHLYKKAQIIDDPTNLPLTPEDIIKELMKLICEKLGIVCSDEELKEVSSMISEIDLDIAYEKVKSEMSSVAEKISSFYNKVANDSTLSDANNVTEYDIEEAEESISKESYLKRKNQLRKDAMPSFNVLSMYFSFAKQIIPKVKSTINYFFKSDSSKIKKIFVFIVCALATMGYIASPIDILPEGITAAIGGLIGSMATPIGGVIGAILGGLAGYTDDIVSFFFMVDWLAPKIDSNYIPAEISKESDDKLNQNTILDVKEISEMDKESYYMLKELIKVANSLDLKGYNSLADETDAIIKKLNISKSY